MLNIRVLVLAKDAASVADVLRARGYMVVAATTADEAREALGQSDFDVVVLDPAREPEMAGELRDRTVEPLVFHGSIDDVEALMPRAAELTRLRSENALLRARLDRQPHPRPLTDDRVMAEVIATAQRLSATDVPVLIRGEAGTGKRLLARLLHRAGPRAPFPLVTLDARTATAEDLLGTPAGPGTLEMARGGCLLLTQAERATSALQAALLGALEAREFRPAGGTRRVRLEARVLAATTAVLKAEVQAGRFREELFYRLSGATLRIPALRERKVDIPLLAGHVLARLGSAKSVSPSALGALMAHAWPGNVRELEIVVERAALLTPGDSIPPEHLALGLAAPAPPLRTDLPLEQMEREYIRAVLNANRGHRGRTARILGIDPKTLYNKLGPGRPRKRP